MSIGPLPPILTTAAGTPAQTAGAAFDRVKLETGNRQRQLAATNQAASAAGIAEADGQDHQPNDRDADGRQMWLWPSPRDRDDEPAQSRAAATARPLDDQAETSGSQLDLTG